ncbi:hypothetical protein [Burkholderia sp. Bp9012]|uniref:hypothetical protein n=1 Tax=Burkholderia sp. Bp9012 TaxID=2184562 RepID=UPI000F59A5CD|nr:hypothetical protein [Burkholderia sp. Bp9012]
MKANESDREGRGLFVLNIEAANDEFIHVIHLNCECNRVDRFGFHHSRTMRTRLVSMRTVRQQSTSRLRRLPRFSGTI